MKKIALILLIVLVMIMSAGFQLSAWADEVAAIVSNGDRVSVFGDIVIDKDTIGDIVCIFGNVEVKNKLQGDVVSVFGNINARNKIDGEVVSIIGDINLDNTITRDVVTVFGKIKMTDNAVINGELVAIGNIERAAGSKVFGQEVKVNVAFLMIAKALVTVVLAFLILILGLVFIAIFKERALNISLVVEENAGRRIAVGLLGLVGFFIVSILLSIVAIGPLLYLFIMITAEVAVSIYFGKQILKVFNANLNVYIEFITGLTTISLLKILLTFIVPQIGFIPYILAYAAFDIFVRAWGIGILIDTKFGTIKNSTSAEFDKDSRDIAFEYNIKESVGNDDEK